MFGWLRAAGEVISKPLTEHLKGRAENARAQLEVHARLQTMALELAGQDAEFAAQWMLVKAQNENTTWKDEYALVVATAPVPVLMLLGLLWAFGWIATDPGTVAQAMFAPLSALPEWWSFVFQLAIGTGLGVTGFNKLRKMS
ncbi:MAG: hypothetical protein AAF628_08410 [Planctomycetota bacterium]